MVGERKGRSLERILIVEDSPSQLALLSHLLKSKGFSVVTATNGIEGFHQVYTQRPDAVVSDVMMPELNGYQLCRLIRNDPALAHVPVILLTSLEERKDRFWAREAGADAYVTKGDGILSIDQELRRVLDSTASERTRRANLSPPTAPPAADEVHSRVHKLLDQLLFEATVNGRVRELARYANNLDEFGRQALNVIAELLDFDLAALWLAKADSHAVITSPAEPPSAAAALALAGALQEVGCRVVLPLPRGDTGEDAGEGPGDVDPQETFVSLVKPLESSGQQFGGLVLLRGGVGVGFNQESVAVLATVAKELAMVARYALSLAEIEQLKADFSSMVVHDLRSPLAAIIGALELFQSGDLGDLEEMQQMWIQRCITRSQGLMQLISDFLDLSKIEAGHIDIEREWIDPRKTFADATEAMTLVARKKGLSLIANLPDELPRIYADPRRIEQVVTNLVANAIKFTERGSIAVSATVDAARNELRVAVRDTGVGIPAEERNAIFEKYRQARAGRGKGTGLGLVICRMLTEAHCGRMELESEPGVGSTFTAVFPLDPKPDEQRAPARGPSESREAFALDA